MRQDTGINKEIGNRIRAVRTKHKLSQEEMAEILRIRSTTHYQNIEYGKNQVSVQHLLILNENFGASPNYIILGEVGNEEEYLYDFFSRSSEEKVKIFTEIAKQAFSGQINDKELQIKNLLQ